MNMQMPDELLLAGKRFKVRFNSRLPEHHLGIRDATEAEWKTAKDAGLPLMTVALWRGYVATWRITERRLFLVDLRGFYAMRSRRPIFAKWISDDLLRVPMGKELATPRDYSPTIHEQQLELAIQAGHVTGAMLFDCKSNCPVHVIAEQQMHMAGRAHPTLKLTTLREELGEVEERPVSPSWWAREFPLD